MIIRTLLVKCIQLACGLCLLLAADRASAALGGSGASVDADRRALSATTLSVTAKAAYAVHEMRSGRAQVRQYVSSPGDVVFAVAWNGPVPPDLSRLLGGYATEVRAAIRAAGRQPGRRSRVIRSGDLTIALWGHMGSLRGRVSLDALIPSEVDVHEIH